MTEELTQNELREVQGGSGPSITIKDGDKTLFSWECGLDAVVDVKPLLDLFR